MPYNREISKFLIQALSLTYQQYNRWKSDNTYDGNINQLPLFQRVFSDYTLVRSLQGYALNPEGMIYLQGDQRHQGATNQQSKYLPYLGFILKSKTNNIIAFRGVRTKFEMNTSLKFAQAPYILEQSNHGNIELGCSEMYIDIPHTDEEESLRDQITQALPSLDLSVPFYVTGHSFGGPFAILTALELVVNHNLSADNVFMYNYGATNVGDPTFASFYNVTVPNSYRVVNTTDYAPDYPQPNITIDGNTYHYQHVGEEWSFIQEAYPSSSYTDLPKPYRIKNHLDIDHTQPEPQVNPYYTAVINEQENTASANKSKPMATSEILTELTGVPSTLLLPLRGRADEQSYSDPLFEDPLSVEWLKRLQLNDDLEEFYTKYSRVGNTLTAIRTYQHDKIVSHHIANSSYPVVVELGAGLSTRFHRVGQNACRWIELDLPVVTELRSQLDTQTQQHQFISASVMDFRWMDRLTDVAPENILFIAEGLLAYFEVNEVQQLISVMHSRFPGATLDVEILGNYAKFSNKSFTKIGAPLKWFVKNEEDLTAMGLQVANVWSLYQLYQERWPWQWQILLKVLTQFPYFRNGYLIVETRL